jgi:hypothetical protein
MDKDYNLSLEALTFLALWPPFMVSTIGSGVGYLFGNFEEGALWGLGIGSFFTFGLMGILAGDYISHKKERRKLEIMEREDFYRNAIKNYFSNRSLVNEVISNRNKINRVEYREMLKNLETELN